MAGFCAKGGLSKEAVRLPGRGGSQFSISDETHNRGGGILFFHRPNQFNSPKNLRPYATFFLHFLKGGAADFTGFFLHFYMSPISKNFYKKRQYTSRAYYSPAERICSQLPCSLLGYATVLRAPFWGA